MTDWSSDEALARHLAHTAGAILLELQGSGLVAGKALGAAGDHVSNAFLLQILKELRPDDFVLSEEAAADPRRLDEKRVWIVDPLDGTREYSEARTDWAVHVALTENGRPTASAVALPGLNLTLCTETPAKLPDLPGPLKILVSRTRPPEEAQKVEKLLGAELVPMGSAGAKAMGVVRGEAHAYLHAGGQYEWDSCAPVGVAKAAGLHCSRIDGSEMIYNQQDPYMPDLLICRPEYAQAILDAIKA